MWDLVERLFATIWMLRAPIACSALIFGGMAAINEVGSRHSHDSAPAATERSCAAPSADPAQAQEPKATPC